MKTNQALAVTILLLFCCLITSCAPNHSTGHEYGFFGGLIHGLVFFPFALLAKLFGLGYGLYADNNSGFFYWLGFILGIGGLGGGAASRR